MPFDKFSFGALRIDGSTYEQDVAIDCGKIRKRKTPIARAKSAAALPLPRSTPQRSIAPLPAPTRAHPGPG